MLSNANPRMSLSASWPESVKQSVASGLESAALGRPVLHLKIGESNMPRDVRARVKVYVGEVADNGVLIGSFALFPATGTEAAQTVATPTFVIDLGSYLNLLPAERKREIMGKSLPLTLELAPFEADAEAAEGQIQIIDAEVRFLSD